MNFDITPAPRRRQPILLERLEGRLLFDAAPLDPLVITTQPAASPLVSDVAHALDLADGAPDAAPQPASSAAGADQVTDTEDRLLAFPGAAGMGAYAQGGRGGDVYHVTNLEDYGTGSLREGVDSATGPRTIVFDVSGTIELSSRVAIDNPYLTVAGQTAPGDGITLQNHGIAILGTHDIVIGYMRFRPGDSVHHEEDALLVYNSHDVMIDHISASWAVDEVIDTWKSDNVTIGWSIIGEGLNDSSHHKGPHSMGSLHSGGGISLHHNLFTSNNRRSPLVLQQADLVNNVIYNWGTHGTIAGWSGSTPDPFGSTQVNLQGNYYVAGPSTTYEYSSLPYLGHEDSELWQSDNLLDANRNGTLDGDPLTTFLGSSDMVDSRFDYPLVPIDDPLTAYHRVLDEAGASLSRDAVDQRLVNEVITETGKIINSQDEVGGWPILQSKSAPPDSDGDGMPNAWEDLRSYLDPLDANDGNGQAHGDGRTYLEEYLAVVAAGDPALGITGPQQTQLGDTAVFTWGAANPLFDPSVSQPFEVDWDGDGQFDQTWDGQLGAPVEHVFDRTGPHEVMVAWTGPTGRTSQAVHRVDVSEPATAPDFDLHGPRQVEAGAAAIFTVAAAGGASENTQSYVFDMDWGQNGHADQRFEGPLGSSVQHEFEAPGIYVVTATATDADGRQTTSTHEFEVTAPAAAPEIDLHGPRHVEAGVGENFTVAAADGASGDAQSYTFDIDWDGDGNVDQQVQGPLGTRAHHTFEQPGTYVVEAVLTDSRGRHTTSTHVVEVTAPLAAPEIEILAPRQVLVEKPAIFTIVAAHEGSNNSQPYTFDIDWNGNGRVDQRIQGPLGLHFEHIFEEPGTVVIEAVLTDARGRHTTSTLVIDVTLPRPALDPTVDDPTAAEPDVTSPSAIRIDGPSVLEAGEVSAFTLTASDSSLNHEQTYLFAIDWSGDGKIDQVIEGYLGTRIEHAFENWGKYSVQVSVLNQQGIERASGGTQILVTEGLPDRVDRVLPRAMANPKSSFLAEVLETDRSNGSTYELSAQRFGPTEPSEAAERESGDSDAATSRVTQDAERQETGEILEAPTLPPSDDQLDPQGLIYDALEAVGHQANPAGHAGPDASLSAQVNADTTKPASGSGDQVDGPHTIAGEELLMESDLDQTNLLWALSSDRATSESTDVAADGELTDSKEAPDDREVEPGNENQPSSETSPRVDAETLSRDTGQGSSQNGDSSESRA